MLAIFIPLVGLNRPKSCHFYAWWSYTFISVRVVWLMNYRLIGIFLAMPLLMLSLYYDSFLVSNFDQFTNSIYWSIKELADMIKLRYHMLRLFRYHHTIYQWARLSRLVVMVRCFIFDLHYAFELVVSMNIARPINSSL